MNICFVKFKNEVYLDSYSFILDKIDAFLEITSNLSTFIKTLGAFIGSDFLCLSGLLHQQKDNGLTYLIHTASEVIYKLF